MTLAGHIAGDVCLRAVAQALASRAREEGVAIARYGGEEFAVMASSIKPLELERMCEELRRAVSGVNLPYPGLPGRNVSISAGLAWRDTFVGDPRLLLEEADRELYEAKAAGDRVAWAATSAHNCSPSIVLDEGVPNVIPNGHSCP
jgi:diguanylate cyclase (GGDEF)-like protein